MLPTDLDPKKICNLLSIQLMNLPIPGENQKGGIIHGLKKAN